MNTDRSHLEFFADERGRQPVIEWLNGLNLASKVRLYKRLARVEGGNWGDYKDLGQGLSELRVRLGPGYRMYFCKQGQRVVVLLAAGDKSTQSKDIALARQRMAAYCAANKQRR